MFTVTLFSLRLFSLPEVLLVLLDGGAPHQDIYIREYKWDITKHFMDNMLKCTPTVPKTKRHLVQLSKTKGSNDDGLGDHHQVHGDLVVPAFKVDDTKHFTPH